MLEKNTMIRLIEDAVVKSPYNNFRAMGNSEEPMWDGPIVGFARGDDPYFRHYKDTIGEFYWLPRDVFRLGTGEETEDGQLTVVSIGFPQTGNTKRDQRNAAGMPSERWLYTRGEWEKFIARVSSDIVDRLKDRGIQAVSLDSIREFSKQTSPKFGMASTWSHRHTAFVAGLGTFGLSDGLITEKGKAMRFTTIIVKGIVEPTVRPYRDYHAYCKFYTENSCGACIARCPVNAITRDGHDKEKCSEYLEKIKHEIGPDFVRNSEYISGCGLCQSKVPCQDRIPGVKRGSL